MGSQIFWKYGRLEGDTRQRRIVTPQMIGNTVQLIGNTAQLIGNTAQMIGNTAQLIGNTAQLIGNTAQNLVARDLSTYHHPNHHHCHLYKDIWTTVVYLKTVSHGYTKFLLATLAVRT